MMAITIVCSIQPQLVTGQNEILLSTALSHLNKIHAFLNRRYVACSLVYNHKNKPIRVFYKFSIKCQFTGQRVTLRRLLNLFTHLAPESVPRTN